MTDLAEAVADFFAPRCAWERQVDKYLKNREWLWQRNRGLLWRGPGTGYRGPETEAKKQASRKKNLAARRASNREWYAKTGTL